jgi:lysophospholipase L1-like esterase
MSHAPTRPSRARRATLAGATLILILTFALVQGRASAASARPASESPQLSALTVIPRSLIAASGFSVSLKATSGAATAEAKTVDALGDSISDTHWGAPMWPTFVHADAPSLRMTATGVLGNGVAEVLARMRATGIVGGFDWPKGVVPYAQVTVVMVGINNIWPLDGPNASIIERGLARIYARLHKHHSVVVPVAILPYGSCASFTRTRDHVRVQVNHWIMRQPNAIDLTSLIGVGTNPTRMRATDTIEGLHPSITGGQVIARAIANDLMHVRTGSD